MAGEYALLGRDEKRGVGLSEERNDSRLRKYTIDEERINGAGSYPCD